MSLIRGNFSFKPYIPVGGVVPRIRAVVGGGVWLEGFFFFKTLRGGGGGGGGGGVTSHIKRMWVVVRNFERSS